MIADNRCAHLFPNLVSVTVTALACSKVPLFPNNASFIAWKRQLLQAAGEPVQTINLRELEFELTR
jgi:hypothetical protein